MSSTSRKPPDRIKTADLEKLSEEQLARIIEEAEAATVAARAAHEQSLAANQTHGRRRGRASVHFAADAEEIAADDAEGADDKDADEEQSASNKEGPLRAWFAVAKGPRRGLLLALLVALIAVLFGPYITAARTQAEEFNSFFDRGLLSSLQ